MNPPQTVSRKRFYRSATVAERDSGGFAVQLDGRPVKTPAGKPLTLPTRALAGATAEEWNAQGETIVPANLPLTKLANTAIDGVADRRTEAANDIMNYAATDLLCYRASFPTELVAAQARAWDPILSWVSAKYQAPFITSSGIAHVSQPASSLEAVRSAIASLGAFRLAAFHVMTTLTGSALIALAHTGGALDADAAWAAAETDEDWQAAKWGEDFEAAQRRKARRAEFDCASRFYKLS
ncbi:MAG: ATP12 family chaperone protein [Rhodomicrobium sp.]